MTAHALGSGIYREPKLVQHPDDPVLWKEIGYDVVSGDLELGKHVVLQRSPEASPQFFRELLNADNAVELHQFDDDRAQFVEVARLIKENVTKDELFPHDIAVIFTAAVTAEKRGLQFRQYLADQGVESHMVGVTSSRDAFLADGKVAVSGPYRAKGNEAPMVYVMDADFCATGSELIKKRNILFTAITRSRGWVRICGCGSGMTVLVEEFKRLHAKDFKLDFTIPTEDELKRMRTLYRDITKDDRRAASDLKKAFERIPSSEEEAQAVLQALPKELRDRILRGLEGLEE